MKFKIILLSLLCMAMTALYAAPVSPSTAMQVASNFYAVNAGKSGPVSLTDVTSQSGFQEFYIFVHPMGKGYVIVAADDCVQPIIGYSLDSRFEFPLPEHVQAHLQGYEEEIAYYKSAGFRPTGDISELWSSMVSRSYSPRNTTSVSPMLTTTWDQSPYYNNLCPDSAGIHAVTGCAATATAQVMKYWNWPVTGTGSHTYTDDNFGTLSANFGATTYQWTQMPNALNSSSSAAQINAVATLMFHIGVAIEMDYGINSSGAYTNSYGYSDLACSENALKDYFSYKSSLHSIYKDNTTDAVWVSLLTAEMDAGRPVIERGSGTGGHAFVVDGYDNNGFFHINWGWGSAYDGYFAHNALNPGGGGTGSSSTHSYNDDQALIVGIEPAGLHTNTQYLTLPQEGGTASFTVSSNTASTTSWTATSNQSWLTVSPNTGYGSGVVTTVNVTASANNTGAVRQALVTITQGAQSATVTVSQSECASSDMCQITLEMNDSYGDGWNGSYLTLSSTSGYVYGTATVNSSYAETQQFDVCSSGLVLTWTSGSQWDDECSFTVYNATNQSLLTASYPFNNSYTINTPCAGGTQPPTTCEVTTFPWNESFENGWNCWTTIDADGDGNYWGRTDNLPAHDGDYTLYSYSYDPNNDVAIDAENYLISPQITLPATGNYQLTFYARCANSSYPDSLWVKMSTTENANVSAFNTTLMTKTMIAASYQQYTVSLSGHNGQSFYLAFVHDSYDGYVVLLDNISIMDASVSYTVTATSANNSMGTATGGGTYSSGAEVTLEATANAGYRFTGWNDGNTENPRSFTVMANASYTAYFADLGTNELHYDNGSVANSMGAGGTIYWAVRFPASVLSSYTTLSSIRIWDAYAGLYEVRVCQGGTDAPGTQLATQTYTLNGSNAWFDATLSTPVTIDPTQPLWIVLYNSDVAYPAAGSTYAGNPDGSWVSLDGTTWNSICDYNFYLSWMVRPVLSSGSTPQTYTIIAVSSNISMGEVIGGGSYPAGTTVQLTANAYQGYEFVNWQDGNTSNPRYITVTGNASYTAYFQAVSTNCTVTSFPWTESFENGWNCWSTIDADGDGNYWGRTNNLPAHDGDYTLYSYSYDPNNNVAIDAENYLISPQITLPATGNYQLTFYARCASNYPDSLWVKMSTTGNTNVSAFNTILMTKTVIAATYQQYTVSLSGHNGQSFYLAFVHDSYNGYVVLLDNISIIDASVSYTVTATSANNSMGTVTGGGTYSAGAEVALEATANAGYRFTGWNDNNTENPRALTVTGNASYTAYFADLGTGELHYDNGTFVSSMGAGGTLYWAVRFPASVLTSYNTLNSVRIWDKYAGSYEVRICQGGTDAPGTQLASQTFSLNGTDAWFDATLSTPVTINPAQPLWIVLYNTGVNYPAAGSTFAGNPDGSWVSLDGTSWNQIYDYGNFYYTWMIRPVLSSGSTPQTYTITAVSSNISMGEVIGGGSYPAGTTVQLIANAAPNHHFVSWNDGNTSNPRNITVTGDATYIATFALDQYQITVLSGNDAMGSVTGGGMCDYGSVIQIKANPNSGYEFVYWNDGNTENPRDITVLGNATYVANFQLQDGIYDNDLSLINVYSHGNQIIVSHAEGESIEIYDMLGKRIAYDALNSQETRVFSLSAKGIYLVRVGETYFKKVVVK